MNVSTFEFFCSSLATFLYKKYINICYAIPVQIKVAIAISRMATNKQSINPKPTCIELAFPLAKW